MTNTNTASGAADQPDALIERLKDAVYEWGNYVDEDHAPRPLTRHVDPHIKAIAAELQRLRAALASAAAPQPGTAYVSLPDEREAFETNFPLWDGVYWDGATYRVRDAYINSYRADRYVGQWAAWLSRASREQAPAQQPAPSAAAHKACKPDMLVNGGALKLALNVLRRAGKHEVADELEATAQPAPTPQADSQPVREGEWIDDAGRIKWLLWRVQDLEAKLAARAPADSVLVRFPVKDEI